MSKRKLEAAAQLHRSMADGEQESKKVRLTEDEESDDEDNDESEHEFSMEVREIDQEEDGDEDAAEEADTKSNGDKSSKKKDKKSKEVDGGDTVQAKKFRNQQRVLILCSRGAGSRHRHLLKDLRSLLPHHKKDAKFDMKDPVHVINEIADLKNCNTAMYLEIRRKSDCYIWISRTPSGPSAKFYVENIHTLGELRLMGNSLLGSRPLLIFDQRFEETPRWKLLKEIFVQIYATPKGHPKSKPFIDHCYSFFVQDNRIWFRNYQIVRGDDKTTAEMELMEIGPRFVLNPIRIFSGSFGGPTLYQNKDYVSPNEARRLLKQQQAKKYQTRVDTAETAHERRAQYKGTGKDELENTFDGDESD